MFYLGLDTSFYTTSLAAVDEAGRVCLDQRRVLPVERGKRGLRPRDAVFLHVEALGAISEGLRGLGGTCGGVAASTRPRAAEGSYLPVFRVSEAWGKTLAASRRAPFFAFSHQDGHIAAGLHSSGFDPGSGPFLAAHLSGGTTELLLVTRAEEGFAGRVLASTADLHAGQFVDRVGVALGLPFPAGKAMEELAAAGRPGGCRLPASTSGTRFSFSGPEAAALRLVRAGCRPADVARSVFETIAVMLHKVITICVQEAGVNDILMVGGVTANRALREVLGGGRRSYRLWWAEPAYCTDNAVGVALLARRRREVEA